VIELLITSSVSRNPKIYQDGDVIIIIIIIKRYRYMSVYMFVCPSVTLVHPGKAAGRNEMPFGSDTRVVPRSQVTLC